MSIANLIRQMAAAGAPAEAIALAVEAIEGSDARVAAGREAARDRKRRQRERARGEVVTVTGQSQDSHAETLSLPPSSPTPPSSTNPIQLPPYSPPKVRQAKAPEKPSSSPIADLLWETASQPSRTRSGRKEVRRAVAGAITQGATVEALEASVRDHCRKQSDFAKGLHRIIEGEHWRDFLERPPPMVVVTTPEIAAQRLRHFTDTGEWREIWGERPKAA